MNDIEARLAATRRKLSETDIDALVIESPHNRRYVTGFTGSAGYAVVDPAGAALVVDGRYYERAASEAPGVTLVRGGNAPVSALAEHLAAIGAERVGFEAEHVSVDLLERLSKATDELTEELTWAPTKGIVEGLREVKTSAEMAALRRSVALADRAMERAWQVARPGMTEAALAWELERFMRESGAEALAFDVIVAAGENSALPHHTPTDRQIQAGEPIVVDLGAKLAGYCSDITRTFSLGPPDGEGASEYAAVWRTVDEANRRAADALRAGISGRVVDGIAREHIAAEGWGDAFLHGLGHGVGMEVHEAPRLGARSPETPLRAGSVVTLEPGIYLEGRFGVRIEDIALVGDDGAEIVTAAAKPMWLELDDAR